MKTNVLRQMACALLWWVAMTVVGSAHAQAYQWEGLPRFPGTFFPSFAISSAGKDAKGVVDDVNMYGFYEASSFAVFVKGTPRGAVVKVRVSVPEIGVEGEIEATPQPTERPRAVVPRMTWSQSRLVAISQPISTEVIYQVSVDGQYLGEQRKPLRVRAITDAPLRTCSKNGKCQEYSQYFAGFVNENHPAIDRLLRLALDIPASPVKQFVGTSQGEAYAMQQVWAIWYLLQRNRVTYSNITTTSDSSDELISQAVRPLSQSLQNGQANCIDGTVLFASILRKIGIEPIIVLVPGHAYLGFYLDSQNTRVAYLETTMLNDANNPFKDIGPSKLGEGLATALGYDAHMQKSQRSFNEALEVGRRNHAIAAPFFGNKPGYSLIAIRKAREAGVLPLPL